MFWSSLISGIILLSFVTTSSTNQSDLLALLAFKAKITDDPLGALSSWNDSAHYCDWYGVTCSRRHRDRVVVLNLFSQKLQGTLSPHIGNLSFLRGIVLNFNNFHGQIPQEVGYLSRLRVLSLSNNSFSGEIPTNLTRCSNLRGIDLIDNKLTGRILALSTLTKLKVLGLGKNQLTGTIPASLGNLTSLTVLSLAENTLVGSIPGDLCRIKMLEYLQLSFNNFTGIAPCLYNLSYVTVISLSGNQLSGTIPSDIVLNLPNIQQLLLGGNKFSGFIPVSLSNASRLEILGLELNYLHGQVPQNLGRLQHLRKLYFSTNQLGSKQGDDLRFIDSLTNCTSLEFLSGSSNMLRGSFPNSMANLSTTITNILFMQNQIHGNISAEIGNLVNLTALHLSGNNITGPIPTSIGKLKNLNQLLMEENRISGTIPTSLGNLTQLTILALSGNLLHGSIPQNLGNCKNLSLLDLSYNKLIGTIPKQVIGLSSLTVGLNLAHNALSGSLPIEVGNLSSLQMLDLSENKLSNNIPDALGNCLTLEKLDLKSNFFEGTLPKSLNTLTGVHYFDISHNKLSGPIPHYFEKFPLLAYLNLSFNEFEGRVPDDGIFRNSSSFSIVGNRKVCGGVVQLNLPRCYSQSSKKQGKSLILKVSLPIILVIICILLASCFFVFRGGRKLIKEPSSTASLTHQHIKITYGELLKATNKFSTDNLIGVGSYGSVYKGVLDQGNTVVAVKVLNLQRHGASNSFLSECNALKNLRHRNLVKIITVCSSLDFQGNEFKALVFGFMPKGNLDELLHPKIDGEILPRKLNFLQRLNIAIDVASAMDYLHHFCQPPIIHCDLKPSNILLDDEMRAHVGDFGLAKIFSGTSNYTPQSEASTTMIRGSIGYVAPEYGMGREVSVGGDVYSYGILLLEMFTEKRPTDEMFQNGLSLHNYVKMALPQNVMNIVDPTMILGKSDEAINIKNPKVEQSRVQECLISTMKLGVKCSVSSPVERLTMREVVTELFHIRERYQTLEIHQEE